MGRDEVSLNEAGNTLQLKCFVKYDIFMITQDIKQKVGEYKPLDTFIGNWERELCVEKGGGIVCRKEGELCVNSGKYV